MATRVIGSAKKGTASVNHTASRFARGFSLAEMLVAMLILTLAATLLASGVPVAIDTYTKTVKSANAQLALSTTATVLRSEIGMARNVVVSGDAVFYLSDTGGGWVSIANHTPSPVLGHGLQKDKYTGSVMLDDVSTLEVSGDSNELVSSAAITSDLCVRYASVSSHTDANNSIDWISFNKLEVVDYENNILASIDDYRILTPFAN